MTALIRVLIADDHHIVRQGLAAMLVARNQMQIVGEARTGREAVALARTLAPDVIVMDMLMPEMDGLEAIVLIKQENPEAKILVLASFGESARVAAAMHAGAMGYMLKDSEPEELVRAIRSVYQGNLVLTRELAVTLLRPAPTTPHLEQFTERELDVLRLLVEGKPNKVIAEQLSISVATVRAHVSNILLKLQVDNRTQAAVVAREHLFRL
ncbi:response regulator transcription factor [Candidatus Chloroploca sp. Khr17]|uniref:response regulator n=1 Tax=Candidatus Chloroploca sp. Khr17 TaxID=2496869 RepID=UPI00196A3A13|nr:response regulator transcription factor [Candidatus Chloroploca sp. Khr17]